MNNYLQRNSRNAKESEAVSLERKEKDDTIRRPWVCIPYIDKASILYSKSLRQLIKDRLDKRIRVVFQTTKVKDSFMLKDTTPKDVCARVVYRFTCRGDPTVNYIGYSNRTLCERVKEHLSGNTAVSDHIANCNMCSANKITISDFEILRKCRTKLDTAVFEAVLIKRHRPVLNRQLIKPG